MDWNAFQSMIKYPLENYQEKYGLARGHSMLLEYGRVYGLTTFGLLLFFKILIFIDCGRLMFFQNSSSYIRYILVPLFFTINIYYLLEPNGFAHRYFWSIGLFVSGMIRGYLDYIVRRMDK